MDMGIVPSNFELAYSLTESTTEQNGEDNDMWPPRTDCAVDTK